MRLLLAVLLLASVAHTSAQCTTVPTEIIVPTDQRFLVSLDGELNDWINVDFPPTNGDQLNCVVGTSHCFLKRIVAEDFNRPPFLVVRRVWSFLGPDFLNIRVDFAGSAEDDPQVPVGEAGFNSFLMCLKMPGVTYFGLDPSCDIETNYKLLYTPALGANVPSINLFRWKQQPTAEDCDAGAVIFQDPVSFYDPDFNVWVNFTNDVMGNPLYCNVGGQLYDDPNSGFSQIGTSPYEVYGFPSQGGQSSSPSVIDDSIVEGTYVETDPAKCIYLDNNHNPTGCKFDFLEIRLPYEAIGLVPSMCNQNMNMALYVEDRGNDPDQTVKLVPFTPVDCECPRRTCEIPAPVPALTPQCNNDGICQAGYENCHNCPNDCGTDRRGNCCGWIEEGQFAGGDGCPQRYCNYRSASCVWPAPETPGAICGDGVCEAGWENCYNCPCDCPKIFYCEDDAPVTAKAKSPSSKAKSPSAKAKSPSDDVTAKSPSDDVTAKSPSDDGPSAKKRMPAKPKVSPSSDSNSPSAPLASKSAKAKGKVSGSKAKSKVSSKVSSKVGSKVVDDDEGLTCKNKGKDTVSSKSKDTVSSKSKDTVGSKSKDTVASSPSAKAKSTKTKGGPTGPGSKSKGSKGTFGKGKTYCEPRPSQLTPSETAKSKDGKSKETAKSKDSGKSKHVLDRRQVAKETSPSASKTKDASKTKEVAAGKAKSKSKSKNKLVDDFLGKLGKNKVPEPSAEVAFCCGCYNLIGDGCDHPICNDQYHQCIPIDGVAPSAPSA